MQSIMARDAFLPILYVRRKPRGSSPDAKARAEVGDFDGEAAQVGLVHG